MNSASMAELWRRVTGLVALARGGVGDLGVRVNAIWANSERLTIEARRADVRAAIAEGAAEIRGNLELARGALVMANAEVDGTLKNLRYVAPDVMATSAAVLGPILNGALDHPERLEAAYRRRFADLADRLVLEKSAAVVADALAGTEEGTAHAERWRRLTEELAPTLPAQEREALAYRAFLDETGRYLVSAGVVVEHDLSVLDPERPAQDKLGGPTTREVVSVEAHRAQLHRYESGLPELRDF